MNAKFILLQSKHSERIGQFTSDVFRIQTFPIFISDLTKALGVLSGRQTLNIWSGQSVWHVASSKEKIDISGDKTIFLVEDNEINRNFLLNQLEKIGFKTCFAKFGKEGFAKWAAGGNNIVLSDCQLPLEDGFEMTSRIRHR